MGRVDAGLLRARHAAASSSVGILPFSSLKQVAHSLSLGKLPHFGQQLPGPCDGFFFVIVAEGPIAEHLEEGVVGIVAADIVQIVVFAGHAHALLRVGRPAVRTVIGAQKDILELHHPGVGEQAGSGRRRAPAKRTAQKCGLLLDERSR